MNLVLTVFWFDEGQRNVVGTFSGQRNGREVSGKVQQLRKVLAQRFGQNVEKRGLPVHRLGRAQLRREKVET